MDLTPPAVRCPALKMGRLGCCLSARAVDSEVTGYAEITLPNTENIPGRVVPGLLTLN